MKQPVSFDLLTQGVARKNVLRHVSQEIDNHWDMAYEGLALVQFPADNAHFIDIHDRCRLALKELQVKPSLPDMIAYGNQSLRIGFGNGFFSD